MNKAVNNPKLPKNQMTRVEKISINTVMSETRFYGRAS